MDAIVTHFGTNALKRALLLGIIGALLTGFMVVNTVSTGTIGPAANGIKLASQTFTDDAGVSVVSQGVLVNVAAAAAAGTTAPGVEATIGLAAVNNTLVANNYAYRFEVKEAAVASWGAAQNYKIELYQTTGATTTLLATHYLQQATVDATTVEGVTATVDVGSATTVPDSFNIIVTRQ